MKLKLEYLKTVGIGLSLTEFEGTFEELERLNEKYELIIDRQKITRSFEKTMLAGLEHEGKIIEKEERKKKLKKKRKVK